MTCEICSGRVPGDGDRPDTFAGPVAAEIGMGAGVSAVSGVDVAPVQASRAARMIRRAGS